MWIMPVFICSEIDVLVRLATGLGLFTTTLIDKEYNTVANN